MSVRKSSYLIAVLLLLTQPLNAASAKILPEFDNDFDQIFLYQGIEKNGLTEAQAIELLGIHYNTEGKDKNDTKAELCFNEALKLDPNLYKSWFVLGLMHMEKPEPYFKKVIELKPDYAQAYFWLASYYCKDEKTQDAIKYFKEYLRVVDKNDQNESGRIDTAKYFIHSMEAGITGYDNITKRQLRGEEFKSK